MEGLMFGIVICPEVYCYCAECAYEVWPDPFQT